MKVKDLTLPHMFPDFKLIGGQDGLSKDIKRIAVFDAPDMSYWLQGGELIIGNGFIFKDDIELLPVFLEKVKDARISAVGIKFDRFTAFLDMSTIALVADKLQLPVFRIPFRYRWLEIIEKVHTEINRRGNDLETDVLASTFLDEIDSIGSLIQSISTRLNKTIFLSTLYGGEGVAFFPKHDFVSPVKGKESEYVSSTVEKSELLPGIPQFLGIREETRAFESGIKSRIYFAESPPYFELHVIYSDSNDTISAYEEKVINRATFALKTLLIEQSVLYSEQYYEISQTMERLLRGSYSNPDKLVETLRKWDLPNPTPCRIAVTPKEDIGSEIIGANDTPYRFYCSMGNMHALLIPWEFENDTDGKNNMALKHLRRYRKPVALGSVANSTDKIPQSFEQAQETLCYMRKQMIGEGIVKYEDVLLELVLSQMLNTRETNAIWQHYWEPLSGLSDRSAIKLDDFATMLVDCDFNLSECSERLNIHYNTARKYSAIIEKKLKISLKDFRTQLMLFVARNKASSK